MREVLIVFLGLAMFAVAFGIVCSPDYCERVDCGKFPDEETCDGTIVPKSSFCSCCNTCIHHVEEGEMCTMKLFFYARGLTPLDHSYVCKGDTVCQNGRCVIPTVEMVEN